MTIRRIRLSSSEFPKLFALIPDPPDVLYAECDLNALSILESLPEYGFSIVGTRTPSEQSLEHLSYWIRSLANRSLVVVSGFAIGIDRAAHEGAFSVGLPTIAVLGTQIEKTYPRSNEGLRDDILDSGGIILSEWSGLKKTHPFHFLKRNRIIAALSKATLIVEAPKRSGALNTAWWANELDRKLYVVPNFPNTPGFEGNQRLLDDFHAEAFWGPHSLGSSWLELSSISDEYGSQKLSPLQMEISRLTQLYGSAPLDELRAWGFKKGYSMSKLSRALQEEVKKKTLSEYRRGEYRICMSSTSLGASNSTTDAESDSVGQNSVDS